MVAVLHLSSLMIVVHTKPLILISPHITWIVIIPRWTLMLKRWFLSILQVLSWFAFYLTHIWLIGDKHILVFQIVEITVSAWVFMFYPNLASLGMLIDLIFIIVSLNLWIDLALYSPNIIAIKFVPYLFYIPTWVIKVVGFSCHVMLFLNGLNLLLIV